MIDFLYVSVTGVRSLLLLLPRSRLDRASERATSSSSNLFPVGKHSEVIVVIKISSTVCMPIMKVVRD